MNDLQLKKRFFISALLLPLFAAMVVAQSVAAQIANPAPVDWRAPQADVVSALLQWYNFAMLFLGYFITHVSSRIPGLNKISNLGWRAVLISAVIGLVFWQMGASGIGVAATFLTIINPYEMGIKRVIGATSRELPAEDLATPEPDPMPGQIDGEHLKDWGDLDEPGK